jgi:hypothetical protein
VPIKWAITAEGKRIPLDAEPTAEGLIWLREDGSAVIGRVHEAPPGRLRYDSHFATCPDSAVFRRPRKPAP